MTTEEIKGGSGVSIPTEFWRVRTVSHWHRKCVAPVRTLDATSETTVCRTLRAKSLSMTGPIRPRIAIVGPAYPFRGGIAHFSNRLAQAMEERFDVEMLTFSRQYPSLLFPGKSQLESSEWKLPHRPERLLDSIGPWSWRDAGVWLAERRPHVIMLVHWLPFFVPSYLGLLKHYRRALSKDDLRAHVNVFLHNVFPHKAFPFTKALMERLLRRADSFLTLSNHVTDHLRTFRPEADVHEGFHPVYDIFEAPVDPTEARLRLGLADRPTMLFFGYVRRYKGLDLLIEALPAIREHVDAQVVVAGEFYDDKEEIRARITELGLDDHVRVFSEYIPNEEVHLYFSAAEVVVQPYRSATPSGVAQTAFNFNKPMIVTDLGVLAEVVPDGVAGYVIPPEDPPALADAVVRFFDAGPDRFKAGVARQKEKYSWPSLTEDLAAFFEHRIAV